MLKERPHDFIVRRRCSDAAKPCSVVMLCESAFQTYSRLPAASSPPRASWADMIMKHRTTCTKTSYRSAPTSCECTSADVLFSSLLSHLVDNIEDRVHGDLERDREGGKALGEEPNDGVARPHEDGHPAHLACNIEVRHHQGSAKLTSQTRRRFSF
jgi:hypothetical protein